ncbi:unnamed protein product [Prorocentrum cordatum]|uniref:Uncharacterized protein n=1 Tax=Prorocentrum cordatum TaxID=2364126 RepID=A0ABN9U844_9DINO|nr:unnamed protein product [Polarella glacialis]
MRLHLQAAVAMALAALAGSTDTCPGGAGEGDEASALLQPAAARAARRAPAWLRQDPMGACQPSRACATGQESDGCPRRGSCQAGTGWCVCPASTCWDEASDECKCETPNPSVSCVAPGATCPSSASCNPLSGNCECPWSTCWDDAGQTCKALPGIPTPATTPPPCDSNSDFAQRCGMDGYASCPAGYTCNSESPTGASARSGIRHARAWRPRRSPPHASSGRSRGRARRGAPPRPRPPRARGGFAAVLPAEGAEASRGGAPPSGKAPGAPAASAGREEEEEEEESRDRPIPLPRPRPARPCPHRPIRPAIIRTLLKCHTCSIAASILPSEKFG